MATSTIKRKIKITDEWSNVGQLSWSQSGVWFAEDNSIKTNGQVLAVTVLDWTQLPSLAIASPYRDHIIFMCNSKPGTNARVKIRIAEEVGGVAHKLPNNLRKLTFRAKRRWA